MTAEEVKTALRRRHPSTTMLTLPGPWTCVEEWQRIDLLAFAAWTQPSPARTRHARIGYEVKVSRSDYRSEILKPAKRALAVALCHEFYFAVPQGLLAPDELAWEEPEWEPGAFSRKECPNRIYRGRNKCVVNVPVPYAGTASRRPWHPYTEPGWDVIPCPLCGGRGYLERSQVELEAPTLWVPRDVGLVEVDARGTARTVRKAPLRTPEPLSDGQLTDLVRWVSYRPDAAHRELHDGWAVGRYLDEQQAAS